MLAFVVGRPILRLKGHYLAMATLGLGIIVSIVIATEDGITGGPDGMAVPPLTLVGYRRCTANSAWYWIVGACLIGAVWLAHEPDRLAERPGAARAARLGARRRARRHRQRARTS